MQKSQTKSEPVMSQALADAQAIVEAAKKRAQEILSEAEDTRNKAKEQGYAEGREAGFQSVAESAIQLISESEKVSEAISEQAAQLALAIGKSLMGEHLKVSPETAKKIALRALKESVVGDTATLLVHPEDKVLLEASLPELKRAAGGARIEIEGDPQITRGGCVVETDFGQVDATLDALLSVVANQLGLPSETGKR